MCDGDEFMTNYDWHIFHCIALLCLNFINSIKMNTIFHEQEKRRHFFIAPSRAEPSRFFKIILKICGYFGFSFIEYFFLLHQIPIYSIKTCVKMLARKKCEINQNEHLAKGRRPLIADLMPNYPFMNEKL